MKVAILGATRGMGRALARRMAARGDSLVLLGRDPVGLSRSAADLESRGQGPVGTGHCDLEDPDTFAPALDRAAELLGGLETVVVTAADFGTQQQLEADALLRTRLLRVDFAHTVLFCEEARVRLLAAGGGTLCVFSSVAGDRPRRRVVLYGAAKAGLSYYLDGIDLAWRGAGLRTVCVKPGFVRTGMTAGLEPPPLAGEPDDVARVVLRAIDRGRRVVYAPPIWRFVLLGVRALPRPLLRRIDF